MAGTGNSRTEQRNAALGKSVSLPLSPKTNTKKMKRQKVIPGSIFKLQFDENSCTFGRVLRFGDVAVYDCRTNDSNFADNQIIIGSKIIFKGLMNDGAIKYGKWPIIGFEPLEKSLLDSKYFLPDVGKSESFKLIQNGGFSFDHPRSAIINVPFGGINDVIHVEQIIKDHYANTENVFQKMNYTDLGLSLPKY